jgi:hypothetical protein
MPSFSFRSANLPDRFLRHRNFLGELTTVSTDVDRHDATFAIMADQFREGSFGLGATVCFTSIRPPFHFLRHQQFRIKLQSPPRTAPRPGSFTGDLTPEGQLFARDIQFTVRQGLSDAAQFSFESTNFPGRFIRHRQFQLFLEAANTDVDRRDATFAAVSPLVPEPRITPPH